MKSSLDPGKGSKLIDSIAGEVNGLRSATVNYCLCQCSSPDRSGKPGEGFVCMGLCAGLAAQPSKKQLSIAFAKVASEAQRATQVWKKVEWLLLLIYYHATTYKLLTSTKNYKLLSTLLFIIIPLLPLVLLNI